MVQGIPGRAIGWHKCYATDRDKHSTPLTDSLETSRCLVAEEAATGVGVGHDKSEQESRMTKYTLWLSRSMKELWEPFSLQHFTTKG